MRWAKCARRPDRQAREGLTQQDLRHQPQVRTGAGARSDENDALAPRLHHSVRRRCGRITFVGRRKGPGYAARLSAPAEPLQRGIERRVALGEAEAHDRADRVAGVERRDRDGGDLVLQHEPLAEGLVVLVEAERGEIDIDEISRLRVDHRKAERAQARGETVAAALEVGAHRLEIVVRLAEAIRDRGLQVRRRREGDELVRLGEHAQHVRRRADEPDLPAGEREDLSGRADLDAALAHPRHRDQRNVAAPVEHDVLPHLVAHRDGVELLAVARQQFEVLAREHGARTG